MTPFLFVLLSIIFITATRLYSKYALYRLDGYALGLLSNVVGGILVLPFVYKELPAVLEMDSFQIFLIIILGILWTYVAWAGNLSIAQNEFSFKEIIRQTRIIWVVLIGILLLDETLGIIDILGIILIISSVFIISFRSVSLHEHLTSKPILLAWSISITTAIIALLEKLILNSTTVLLYAFLSYLSTSLGLMLFLNHKRRSDALFLIKTHYKETLIVSILMVLSYYTVLSAYQLLPISIAYPLVQSSTAIGVVIGTFLFEENRGWQRKWLAAIIAVVGVIVIKVF